MATILTTGSATATALNLLTPSGISSPSSGKVQTPAPDVEASKAVTATPSPVRPEAIAQRLEQVQQAIERLKQSIKPTLANTLEFQIDDSTGRTLIKVMDTETNTLVRQIPSEEVIAVARAIDRLQGRSGFVEQQA